MDYEKAYKAVLETATKWIEDGCTDKERICLESVFPELRESEDERVRKWIYNLIGSLGDPQDEDAEKELEEMQPLALAYLEKQKDASKAIEAVDRIDKYIDEHVANAHDMKDSNPDKKYYRGWDDALGEMAGILQDVYSNEKQKESLHIQKTCKENADSFTDEDERIRKWLVDYFKAVERCCIHWDISPERIVSYLEKQKPGNVSATTMAPSCWEVEQKEQRNYHKLYEDITKSEWFKKAYEGKSLGSDDEQKEQKPVEWSDEDQNNVNVLLSIIGEVREMRMQNTLVGSVETVERKRRFDKLEAWLKSLRPPQYCEDCKLKRSVENWKPSKEQIQGLAHAINLDVYDAQRYKLDILYNDLKKLM